MGFFILLIYLAEKYVERGKEGKQRGRGEGDSNETEEQLGQLR